MSVVGINSELASLSIEEYRTRKVALVTGKFSINK